MSTFPGVVLTSSIYLEGSVSHGRRYEKRKYAQILLGQSESAPNGALPYSSAVVDVGLTGTFTSPSWTHASDGFNQAYVGVSLSSSYFETKTLNYFRSGSSALENSAVPASASLFYSKNSKFQTIIVKHSASIADVFAPSSGIFPPIVFAPGTGTYLSINTGSTSTYLDGSAITSSIAFLDRPTTILMNVPVRGRLVDIKVWIDIIHLSSSAGQSFPLSNLGIALRSPNVRWGNSHPIRNDFNFNNQSFKSYDLGAVQVPFSFYRDTFILWDGPSLGAGGVSFSAGAGADKGPWQGIVYEPFPGDFGGNGSETARYPSWQRDRCMRTVFSDGSPVPNPRHIYAASMSGNFVGAPCTSSLVTGPSNLTIPAAAYGFNVPWTSDKGGLLASDPTTYITGGSPPKGWLNGPGGTNDVNEWPTTGVNYGTPTIKPFYPLLDPIFAIKTGTDESQVFPAIIIPAPGPPVTPDKWRGFRPGLRGTEISGTWQLLFASDRGDGNFGVVTGSCALYFRQARLEITYESSVVSPPASLRASKKLPPRRSGPILLWTISGSDLVTNTNASDYFKTQIWAMVPSDAENGRTFGVAPGPAGINRTDVALAYRLSGTLSGISGSTPGWLFNNQWGMPQIPISSASLVPLTASLPSTAAPGPFISPVKLLDGPRRLADVAQDVNPALTLAELAIEFVSGSTS